MITGRHCVERFVFVYMRDILPLIENQEPKLISFSDINYAGPPFTTNATTDGFIHRKKSNKERYDSCDISLPGIVVKNPTPNEKYRLVDGGHRLAKMLSCGISESYYHVIEKEEYEALFKDEKGNLVNKNFEDEFSSFFDTIKGTYSPINDPSKILYLRDIIPVLRGKHHVELDFDQIDHKEVEDTQQAREYANTLWENETGIVVKKGERYELLDDEYKIFKMKFWKRKKHHYLIVTPEEIEPHFRCAKTGLRLNETRIELKEVHDVFGFSVPVFRYINHEKYKTALYNEYCSHVDTMDSDGSYRRTDRRKNILSIDSLHSLDLLKATLSAYDCFYRHVYGITYSDSIEITQSWMVDTPPWDGKSKTDPMTIHNHFLSLACSTYYLKHKSGFGGNLRLYNPISPFMDQITEFAIMRRLGPSKGTTAFFDLPVEESDIVIFPGAFIHTISPYTNKDTSRVSLPSNSTINPLRSDPNPNERNKHGIPCYGYRYTMRGHHEL